MSDYDGQTSRRVSRSGNFKRYWWLLLIPCLMLLLAFCGNNDRNGSPDSIDQSLSDNRLENCQAAQNRQADRGIAAGGGPKENVLGPTNCDGFFTADPPVETDSL